MAFVNRNKRHTDEFFSSSIQTTEFVGPGAYVDTNSINPRSCGGLAPFGASADRGVLSIPYKFSPGPGEYEATNTSQLGKISGASTAFQSRTKRHTFNQKSPQPGPGKYAPKKNDWVRFPENQSHFFGGGRAKNEGGMRGSTKIEWVRVAQPPSIPYKREKYGYIPGDFGELISEKGPDLSNQEMNTAASRQTSQHHHVSPWKVSKTRRSLFDAKPSPGPGTYNLSSDNHPSNDYYQQQSFGTSSLASNTKRFAKAETPGPGPFGYDKVKASQALRKKIDIYGGSHFGSTAERKSVFIRDNSNPGPAYYGHHHQNRHLDKRRLLNPSRMKKSTSTAFSSTSQRFGSKSFSHSVGPGEYTVSSSFEKESFGRNASFGITAKRFNKKKGGKTYAMPGPGFYNSTKPPSPKPLPVSFGAAKRFVSAKDERPPVGIYETRMSWGKGSPSRTPGSAAFKSKTKRLDPASNKKIPGPGDYEIGSKNKGRVIRATPPSFGSGSTRFENIKSHLSPGPGSYGDGGQALTAKKTYNVTIDM